ncbi:MAG TPA: hypothetical protein DFS52_12840 [Myxococcales bacterium]|nr:hypothetical protein [Myxococcales bacterium]
MREYSAESMVRIPRVDANHAATLGESVLTAADAVTLPVVLEKPREKLRAEVTDLKKELSAQKSPPPASSTVAADRRVDAAWSGLHDVLTGWAKLPETKPSSAKARTLLETVFSDGVRFVKFAHRAEWAESEARLNTLKAEPNASLLRELGAQEFVDEVSEAHRLYGEALGVTAVRPIDDKPEVRAKMEAFAKALRAFVLHVTAFGASDEPEAPQMAEKLLAPLTEWEAMRSPSKKQPDADDVPVPPTP